MNASFKFIERNCSNTILLFPGWATDYKIFAKLKLNFNYLVPTNPFPLLGEKELLSTLKENNLKKISLLGWSMGGFVASELAAKHSEMIDQIILVSIRKQYSKTEITGVKDLLQKNKNSYLYKFYQECFSRQEEWLYFKKYYLKEYLYQFNLDILLSGLDYLSSIELKPEQLKKIDKITFIHGAEDKIAPLTEALEIQANMKLTQFLLLPNTGHFPFFREDFLAGI